MCEILVEPRIVTHVSDIDFEDVCQKKLYLNANGYAYFIDKKPMLLHLYIGGKMGILTSDVVDHKDRVRLNNRRDNLRPATFRQNARNRSKRKHLKYIGVSKSNNKYAPFLVTVDGFPYGPFTDEIQAAKIRDSLAKALFGEFAVLNFPE